MTNQVIPAEAVEAAANVERVARIEERARRLAAASGLTDEQRIQDGIRRILGPAPTRTGSPRDPR